MSEQPKPPFFATKQDEIDFWKRRYHDEKRFTSTIQQELEHQRTKYSKLLSYSERHDKFFDELFDSAEKAGAAFRRKQNEDIREGR